MRSVVVTLHKKEIMSDVVNAAYIVGRRLSVPENEEKASDVQTPEEGPDKYVVARAMSTALYNIRARCGRYLTSGRLSDNNSLEDIDGDYVYELSMPERWNYGVTTDLTSQMHNYVVDFCIFSIFEKTNPNEAANYSAKATLELNNVKSLLEMRTAPVRRSSDKLY